MRINETPFRSSVHQYRNNHERTIVMKDNDLEFEKTLEESKILMEGAARVAGENYEFTLESILEEFGSHDALPRKAPEVKAEDLKETKVAAEPLIVRTEKPVTLRTAREPSVAPVAEKKPEDVPEIKAGAKAGTKVVTEMAAGAISRAAERSISNNNAKANLRNTIKANLRTALGGIPIVNASERAQDNESGQSEAGDTEPGGDHPRV